MKEIRICCLRSEDLRAVLEGFDLESCYRNLELEDFLAILTE